LAKGAELLENRRIDFFLRAKKSAQKMDSRAVRFHNFLRIAKGAGNHLVHSTYGLTDGIKQRMALVQWKEKWIGKVPQLK
jgi:hypothetical protein